MAGYFCPKLSGVDLDGQLVTVPCQQHACMNYQMIEGLHPQTGETVAQWDCAYNWTNVLLIENAQQQRQTGAAVESFRNSIEQQAAAIPLIVTDAIQPLPGGSSCK